MLDGLRVVVVVFKYQSYRRNSEIANKQSFDNAGLIILIITRNIIRISEENKNKFICYNEISKIESNKYIPMYKYSKTEKCT